MSDIATPRQLLKELLLITKYNMKFENGSIMCITAMRNQDLSLKFEVHVESHETLETTDIDEALDCFCKYWKPTVYMTLV